MKLVKDKFKKRCDKHIYELVQENITYRDRTRMYQVLDHTYKFFRTMFLIQVSELDSIMEEDLE